MDYRNIKFWHKVKLADGEYTPGMVDIQSLRSTYLFDDVPFKDKSILDIGCWDGYFSFESERKGAKEVVALDKPEYRWGEMDGFNFLKEFYKSNVQFIHGSVYELTKIFKDKKFDIILCYGVLYHISDPLLALKNILSQSNEYVILEGIFFNSAERILKLIEYPYPSIGTPDKSNIYRISTGYVSYISEMFGFKIDKIYYQSNGERASIILKKYKDSEFCYIIHD